jgi:hypothetical protein
MSEINIFEYAAKNKLRFPFRGNITTEDLYDLSPANLDSIYKTLSREAKKNEEESLLADKSANDVQLGVKIDIIKYIVAEKLAATERMKKAAATKLQADKIRAVLAKKQDAALENMSQEELQKMLEDLGA